MCQSLTNEICNVCSDKIDESEKFIECEVCGNYAHIECSKINIGLRVCVDCEEILENG